MGLKCVFPCWVSSRVSILGQTIGQNLTLASLCPLSKGHYHRPQVSQCIECRASPGQGRDSRGQLEPSKCSKQTQMCREEHTQLEGLPSRIRKTGSPEPIARRIKLAAIGGNKSKSYRSLVPK